MFLAYHYFFPHASALHAGLIDVEKAGNISFIFSLSPPDVVQFLLLHQWGNLAFGFPSRLASHCAAREC